MNDNWPFADPKNVATFTTCPVVKEHHSILRVTHDSDDGAWQFLEWDTPREEDARIVSLEGMTQIDPKFPNIED